MSFLAVRRVTKGYGTRPVLDQVSLEVARGELVAIVGYSGSGKTTLISLIAGLLRPDAGEVVLDGVRVEGPAPERGVVFQNYSLLPWLTVFDNVHLAVEAVATTTSSGENRARTGALCRLVGLGDAVAKRPRELSGGMRQRVAVARGLATNPKLLLLDEPFSALDAITRATLQAELARILAEEHMTAVLITNDVEEAILLADRIYPLTAGPGATLGDPIAVHIRRPRSRRRLNLDPEYQRVRRELIDFLVRSRGASTLRAAG